VPDTQAPLAHESPVVHELPSSQLVPSLFTGFEQVPVAELQVPAVWHWSLATQDTGLPPVHVPDTHVSVWVHAFPSEHAVPSVFVGFEHTPFAGLQVPAA